MRAEAAFPVGSSPASRPSVHELVALGLLVLLAGQEAFAWTTTGASMVLPLAKMMAFSPFVRFAALGSAIFALAHREVWSTRIMRSAGIGTAVFLTLAFTQVDTGRLVRLLPIAAALSTIVALLVESRLQRVARLREIAAGAALFPLYVAVTSSFLPLTNVHGEVADPVVFRADAALGFQPSFWMGQVFAGAPLLRSIAGIVYSALPAGVAAACAMRREGAGDPLLAFIGMGAAGFVLYMVFPVVGPVFYFPSYPHLPAEVASGWAAFDGAEPRNCMPSLHTSWALLIHWTFLRRGAVLSLLGTAFLVFTLLATVGFGYHYLTDLVVAFPFALALFALVAGRGPRRFAIAAAAAAAMLAWLAAVFSGILAREQGTSWLAVLFVVATVVICEGGALVLSRASGARRPNGTIS